MPGNARETRAKTAKSQFANTQGTADKARKTSYGKSPLLSRLEAMAPNQVNSPDSNDTKEVETHRSIQQQANESVPLQNRKLNKAATFKLNDYQLPSQSKLKDKRLNKLQDKAEQPAEGDEDDDVSDANAGKQMFSKEQTTILQKWFLDHIEHPYVTKIDKQFLATQTELTTKQITGWFMNNRKRKYQRLVKIAKKRGKGWDYVKEVMIVKFDKDLDKSFSPASSMKNRKRSKRSKSKFDGSDSSMSQQDESKKEPNQAIAMLPPQIKQPDQIGADQKREKLLKLLQPTQENAVAAATTLVPGNQPGHPTAQPIMTVKLGNKITQVIPPHNFSFQPATTVSLSANGSGSQLSSLMGRQTFIPIIYTDAAIDEMAPLDETFLQKVRPVVPIEAQIQMGLQNQEGTPLTPPIEVQPSANSGDKANQPKSTSPAQTATVLNEAQIAKTEYQTMKRIQNLVNLQLTSLINAKMRKASPQPVATSLNAAANLAQQPQPPESAKVIQEPVQKAQSVQKPVDSRLLFSGLTDNQTMPRQQQDTQKGQNDESKDVQQVVQIFNQLGSDQKARFLTIFLDVVKQAITEGLLDTKQLLPNESDKNDLTGELFKSLIMQSRSNLQRQKDALKEMVANYPRHARQSRALASEKPPIVAKDSLNTPIEDKSGKSAILPESKSLFNQDKTDSILATHRSNSKISDLYTMLGLNLSGSVKAGDPASNSRPEEPAQTQDNQLGSNGDGEHGSNGSHGMKLTSGDGSGNLIIPKASQQVDDPTVVQESGVEAGNDSAEERNNEAAEAGQVMIQNIIQHQNLNFVMQQPLDPALLQLIQKMQKDQLAKASHGQINTPVKGPNEVQSATQGQEKAPNKGESNGTTKKQGDL